MSENFSMQIKKSNTDEWYTPEECVEYIVPYLKGFKKILCPFDKAERGGEQLRPWPEGKSYPMANR